MSLRSLLPCLILALLLAAPVRAADPVAAGSTEHFAADTRGFGNVTVTARVTDAQHSWTTYAAEDPAHATLLASKRLADLLGFGDLRLLANKKTQGSMVALAGGGVWLLGTAGADVHELYAPDTNAATAMAAAAGLSLAQVPLDAYPRWLDCFDNSGPGTWVGGGGDQYVLPNDFEWLQARRLAMCTLSPTQSRLVAPGVVDTTIHDWHSAMAAKYGLAYRSLLFPDSHAWSWNREPLPYVQGYEGFIAHPWLDYQSHAVSSAYEPNPKTDRYEQDLRYRLATHLKDDPNFMAWHGCTEIPAAGVMELAAVAGMPYIKALWHAYLVGELHLDLAAVGRLYRGDAKAFATWDEVEVPLPTDFVGWDPATCVDLRGTWQMHADSDFKGAEGQWWVPEKAPADWLEADCGDPMIMLYAARRNYQVPKPKSAYWMRRTMTVTAAQLPSQRYLHIARSVWHGNSTPLFDVWVNGKPLAPITEHGAFEQCFDMGDTLVAGDNAIVMQTHGNPVPGYIFTSALPFRVYPLMTEPENRLWYDTVNFDAWLRVGVIEANLVSQRAADPNRPLKLMATINLLDLTADVCRRLGAYQHDTGGAGGYWCPMSGARLATTHGMPWSCEQGGPPRDVAGMQAAISRYLMYGNDAVDLVFSVAHYRDKPEVAEWFDKNLNLIQAIGKLHLPTPPIGVLRSARATRLGFAEPWNWDIGRGPLQAVGRNFSYLETPDLLNGTLDEFPVIIDAGTVILTDPEIAAIQAYVRRGGIFVAQFHTGRYTPSKPDAWPLAEAYGLSVTPRLITGENYHKWPLARIHVAEDQAMLPSLRGKEIEGSGVSIDYLGRIQTGGLSITSDRPEVHPVATWDDGTMAIADVQAGRGHFVYLGTPFYTRMRDSNGVWVNEADRSALLDEFLTSLGVPRDSWSGDPAVWAERWRSKNGVYDLYPVCRNTSKADEATVSATVRFRAPTPVKQLVDLGTLGHPTVDVTWQDGTMILPATDYGLMQYRLYAAPSARIALGGLDWFHTQSRLWRALPAIESTRQPEHIQQPADVLPLPDQWQMHVGALDNTDWISGAAPADWKQTRLGAFATLGLPEDSVVQFRRTVQLPPAWKGQSVTLTFDAEGWFWGITPYANLWINGKPADMRLPIGPMASPSFSLDMTALAAADGTLTIALEVDGSKFKPDAVQKKPFGVTGLFYLQTFPAPVQVTPLAGPWFAGSDFDVLAPAEPGKKAAFSYLQTSFTLPAAWPGERLFLQSPQPLAWMCLNGKVIKMPSWMQQLDVSGLVYRDGRPNVLRWSPNERGTPAWDTIRNEVVPPLSLVWLPAAE